MRSTRTCISHQISASRPEPSLTIQIQCKVVFFLKSECFDRSAQTCRSSPVLSYRSSASCKEKILTASVCCKGRRNSSASSVSQAIWFTGPICGKQWRFHWDNIACYHEQHSLSGIQHPFNIHLFHNAFKSVLDDWHLVMIYGSPQAKNVPRAPANSPDPTQ